MLKEPQRRIRWSGDAAVSQVVECLESGIEFQLELPPNVHHALFSRLRPDAAPGQPELLDIEGGSELIESIASVASLEALNQLDEPLAAAGAHLSVVSPHPRIVVTYAEGGE